MTMQVPTRTYKLVQDFLKTEIVVRLHNQPYSPELNPCEFFLFTEKTNTHEVDIKLQNGLGSAIVQCRQCVPKKVHLIAFRTWILRVELCFCLGRDQLN